MNLRWKYLLAGLLAGLLAAVCCGCAVPSIVTEPEDLYSLPRLPDEYMGLERSIKAILAEGGEYAAPTSGTNIQPVQMVDLNGDGQEEALAFIRKSTDERQQKIYVFSARDSAYEQAALIESSASSISSLEYADFNQDGQQELIVGWKLSTELQVLSVYALNGSNPPVELLRTIYVRYAMMDFNGDGVQEIVVFHADSSGNSTAEYYAWQQNVGISFLSAARLSMTMAELSRIEEGTLTDGSPALFVCGVDDASVAIMDILSVRETGLTNLVLSPITGVSSEIFHYMSLYPMDINHDGVTEVPIPVSATGANAMIGTPGYRINWRAYDADGKGTTVQMTYHNTMDGWYLELPETWLGKISVSRRQTGVDEIAVTFSIDGLNGVQQDFLNIYTLTGSGREYRIRGDRFVLRRQPETIFAAELLPGNEEWAYGLTQDEVRTAFNLITTEWLPDIS